MTTSKPKELSIVTLKRQLRQSKQDAQLEVSKLRHELMDRKFASERMRQRILELEKDLAYHKELSMNLSRSLNKEPNAEG
jgi:hypothetical protein